MPSMLLKNAGMEVSSIGMHRFRFQCSNVCRPPSTQAFARCQTAICGRKERHLLSAPIQITQRHAPPTFLGPLAPYLGTVRLVLSCGEPKAKGRPQPRCSQLATFPRAAGLWVYWDCRGLNPLVSLRESRPIQRRWHPGVIPERWMGMLCLHKRPFASCWILKGIKGSVLAGGVWGARGPTAFTPIVLSSLYSHALVFRSFGVEQMFLVSSAHQGGFYFIK